MAAATQSLIRLDTNTIKTSDSATIPRIDLAKLDNIPYYIESMNKHLRTFKISTSTL